MKQLRPKDLDKLSQILDIDLAVIEKLNSMGMINQRSALSAIIANDWVRLRKLRRFRNDALVQALSDEYDFSKSSILRIVHPQRGKKQLYCEQCGEPVGKIEAERNSGICDKCMADKILNNEL